MSKELYLRRTTWHFRFTDPNGRRARGSTQTGDKKAAQEFLDRLKADLWRVRKLGETPEFTFGHAVTAWMPEAAKKRSIEDDKDMLRVMVPFMAHLVLTRITMQTLKDFKSWLRAAREQRDENGEVTFRLSDSRVNRYLSLISRVLHFAHESTWIAGVPPIPYEEEGESRIRWLTGEEAARLVAELPTHLRQMARFTLATGLRQSNVSYLQWSQVSIELRRAWIYADEAKGKRAISVPLSDDAIAILKEQMIDRHPQFVFVYTNNRGESAPVAKCKTKAFDKACERAGIENFTWHDLRHTWATWHVMNRTSLEVLQKLGAWKSYEMVQRYAHVADGFADVYAGNAKPVSFGQVTQNWHKPKSEADLKDAKNPLESLGWLMGLEPTTTGITIRDSTN